MNKIIKTYKNWKGSLHNYLQVGDLIDEDLKNYFIDVMPPRTMNSHIIQIGEPYNHVDGRPTYATITKTSEGWMYAGTCHAGETEDKD